MIIHLLQRIIFTITVLAIIIVLAIQMIVRHLQTRVAVIAVAAEIKKKPFYAKGF